MSSSTSLTSVFSTLLSGLYVIGALQLLYLALRESFEIRLYAIKEYGRVIHEFDPYFNYRATEYLWQHGWQNFRTWFDYMSWYPLGRPVGTTIYPGMQITSVLIKKYLLPEWSVNDVCCFVPAWFGVLATLATAFLAYECSVGTFTKPPTKDNINNKDKDKDKDKGRTPQEFDTIFNSIPIVKQIYQVTFRPLTDLIMNLAQKEIKTTFGLRYYQNSYPSNSNFASPAIECGVFTACIMAIVPAHLMRSVGGGYDNESVAMFAMTFTFYTWCRSLRGGKDQPNYTWAVISGIAYGYMVAAWGGYVFVLNLVGVHASMLVLLGRYSTKLHRSYTIFYGIGTLLAIQVPVVGFTPLKSLEQVGPLVAFLAFQLIEFCEIQKRQRNLNTKQTWMLRIQIFGGVGLIAALLAMVLAQQGYFGPISSRVRGLFVKHTKTGNPLVDSVAEHQPATDGAYEQYLGDVVKTLPYGFALVAMFFFHDASSFLVVYAIAAYFLSNRMVRLILLTAPIASVFCGIILGHLCAWGLGGIAGLYRPNAILAGDDGDNKGAAETDTKQTSDIIIDATPADAKENGKKEKKRLKKNGNEKEPKVTKTESFKEATVVTPKAKPENIVFRLARAAITVYIAYYIIRPKAEAFHKRCHEMAKALSHPTIIQKGQTKDGRTIVIDDYREAYFWLRDRTPADARIMAWWDYGYQIAGIGNRTTIADGNTWNHEHIALLGRALTSPLKDGHRIARHLADYVLLWAGGGGDDLAKSPHMRRIANSVYRFLCPGDPTCRSFGFNQYRQPSKSMKQSLLFQLHGHGLQPGIEADKNRFRMQFQSKHGKVRIFKILSVSKESKDWVANPANRVCDAPGSWFCPGQYPPGLQKVLKEKKDFRQLEDFNTKAESDSDYTRQYLENLNNPDKARKSAQQAERKTKLSNAEEVQQKKKKARLTRLPPDEIEMMNNEDAWGDNSMTTAAWQAIHANDIRSFRDMLVDSPEMAHVRSKDGRGPIWWAHEYGRTDFVNLLKKLGVSEELRDESGATPLQMSTI